MIEEVVGTILEAEDKAEEIKKQAKEDAKRRVDEALASSSVTREQILKKRKLDVKQAKSVSASKADGLYEKIVEDGAFQATSAAEKADKNMDRAVKEIVRSVIG